MPRIRCHYINCVFLDDDYCSAAAIEVDPDEGCLTYSQADVFDEDEWDDPDELDDWEELESDDDLWIDDEDEEEDEEEDEDY